MTFPLRAKIDFKGTGVTSKSVLQGCYKTEFPIDPYVEAPIYELQTPHVVADSPIMSMTMITENILHIGERLKRTNHVIR